MPCCWHAGKVAAEYVWIGGSGQDLRSKTKTLSKVRAQPNPSPTPAAFEGCCRESPSRSHVWQGNLDRVIFHATEAENLVLGAVMCMAPPTPHGRAGQNVCPQKRGRFGSGAPAGAKLVVPADMEAAQQDPQHVSALPRGQHPHHLRAPPIMPAASGDAPHAALHGHAASPGCSCPRAPRTCLSGTTTAPPPARPPAMTLRCTWSPGEGWSAI